MGMKAGCCFGHCMLEIGLKVITIYTRRKGSPMMVPEQLGTLMRLIGPFVWVYLMARVHSGCFREIWVDCAQDGQVRRCDTKVFLLIKTRHVFSSYYFGMTRVRLVEWFLFWKELLWRSLVVSYFTSTSLVNGQWSSSWVGVSSVSVEAAIRWFWFWEHLTKRSCLSSLMSLLSLGEGVLFFYFFSLSPK